MLYYLVCCLLNATVICKYSPYLFNLNYSNMSFEKNVIFLNLYCGM